MSKPREHLPELDWLKGFAILCVIGIHAKAYADSFLFLQIVNRAVHTFLVLFGISSELWWRRELTRAPEHALRRFYIGRFSRLLPGYWAMTAVWWLVVTFWHAPPGDLRLGPTQALISFLGYAPWIGTSWFVTIILQYVLIFPLLRRAVVRVGMPLGLVVSAAATFASCWFLLQIVTTSKALFGGNVPWPGWYYQWIFAPRVLWDVTAGIWVARIWDGRISRRATLVALVITSLGVLLTYVARGAASDRFGPVREMAVAHLVDVPLSIALLGAFRWLPLPGGLQLFLAFCGRWSWGIYLGHLLVHELVQIAGYRPFAAAEWVRLAYIVVLFLCGTALALLGARLQELVQKRGMRERVPTVGAP